VLRWSAAAARIVMDISGTRKVSPATAVTD